VQTRHHANLTSSAALWIVLKLVNTRCNTSKTNEKLQTIHRCRCSRASSLDCMLQQWAFKTSISVRMFPTLLTLLHAIRADNETRRMHKHWGTTQFVSTNQMKQLCILKLTKATEMVIVLLMMEEMQKHDTD